MSKEEKQEVLEPFEPIKLFGAELDVQVPDDLPPFVFLAVQEVFAKVGELPNFVLATMMGAALTHHPKVKRTIQNYEDAKKLPENEQVEIVSAGSTLLNVFSRRMKELADQAAPAEGEDDTPNDSTPESGETTSSAEPTPA